MPETGGRALKIQIKRAWTHLRPGRFCARQLDLGDRLCRSLASTYPASQLPLVHSFRLSHLRPIAAPLVSSRCNDSVARAETSNCNDAASVAPLASPLFPVPGFPAASCWCTPLSSPARASQARPLSTKHSHIARALIELQHTATCTTSIAR